MTVPFDARGGLPPTPCYLSVHSRLVPGTSPRFTQLLTWLKGEARDRGLGWERVALCYGLTDIPEQWLEVYRLPSLAALHAAEALREAPHYGELEALCRTRRMEVSSVLPFESEEGGAPPVEVFQGYFLQVSFTVARGERSSFDAALRELLPLFRGKRGWRMALSSQGFVRPECITQFWRFPDADVLFNLMEELRGAPRYAAVEQHCEAHWQRVWHVQGSNPDEELT
jgi:hypothetical protein